RNQESGIRNQESGIRNQEVQAGIHFAFARHSREGGNPVTWLSGSSGFSGKRRWIPAFAGITILAIDFCQSHRG
ncbi:MAG: hypothetical protein WKF61_07520, partial [Luteimonas sp.]